ncbi:uncharacterized protein LOC135222646 [Macrobrachium nipponense]|uniref:uncharacterized protein LOC135222646 n=1 Tax=Macrobrachium nipponense TaxID=159736 RepID=UPI0030C82122
MYLSNLQMVRCPEAGCLTVLQKMYGHEVCQSHASCAIQLEGLLVWHPEACEVCYGLVRNVTDESVDPTLKASSLMTLKAWVGGFRRNVGSGRPYVLSEEMCFLLYPNAKVSAAVAAEVAAPIIERIRQETQAPPEDQEGLCAKMTEVTAISLHRERMTIEDQEEGREVGEAGNCGANVLSFSPTPSSSSFQGFSAKSTTFCDRSVSVNPKVKTLKTKSLPKAVRPVKPSPAGSARSSLAPKPLTSKARPTESDFDQEAFTTLLMKMVSEVVVDSRLQSMSTQLSSGLETFGQSIPSLAQKLQTQEELVAGFIHSGCTPQSFVVPDASKLPPFENSNPWRLALHAPFSEGRLTIEGCGTRPVEDYEFFPPGLQFPFPGYARLAEEALVRVDKVPEETVIYPRDQAQSAWVRILTEWECVNTELMPHNGCYTMFVAPDNIPTPCTSKIAELTLQAGMENKPMPQLKETEATSLLFPRDLECWVGAPATFTVGKLNRDCAMTQFGELLPRIPDTMLKAEFEARCRLSRSINSVTTAELTASVFAEEPLFRVLTKSMLQAYQSDLYDFIVARRACRKHVFANASIRHEPNKLINASIWGANIFPEDMVNSVLSEAARANQNLRDRWGLNLKRNFEAPGPHAKRRRRPRQYKSSQTSQPQAVVQAVPVSQISKPSTSKAQPQQQFDLLQSQPTQQPSSSAALVTSPAFNASFKTQGAFRGYNRHARGSRARGANQQRAGSRVLSRGRGFRGGRGSKTSTSQ